ncbi:restriction endonuclease subunit S [Bacteroides ovatus]|nr:restriction endonuclease subunit S [Bacteroides ovatus]MDC2682947.1 restriction endonuclease subunit S [Bacteroides ovatus]
MDTKKLRQKILDLAIRGKLVPQDPNDEPASVLLERIKEEKERLIKEGKIKKSKKTVSSDTYHYEQILPKGWCWTVLGDIFQHNNGKQKTSSNQEGELYKYITTSNVYWNKFDFSEVKQMRFLESEFEKYIAKKGDLLVCEGGDIGRAAIWNYDYNICIQNHLHRLRAYIPVCTKYFLFSLMDSKAKGVIKGKGIGLMSLSANDLHNIIIALPPLSEQYRIVTEIEHWFTLISQIEQDKSALQSVIKQAKSKILRLAIYGKLVPQDPNDEPASELLKRINPNAEITCDNGHYTQLPDGWAAIKVGDVAIYINGRAFKPEDWMCEGLPIIRIQNLNDKNAGYNRTTKTYESKYLIHNGDLLFAWAASLGTYIWNGGNAWLNQHIFKVEPYQFIEKSYLYYIFKTMTTEFYAQSHGSGMVHITKKQFENIELLLPPLKEQKRIVQTLEQISTNLDQIVESL